MSDKHELGTDSEGQRSTRRTGPTVAVVGSVNVDLVVRSPRLPTPGETVTDGILDRSPGGKGANQALAARHSGADASLIAAVGKDEVANEALAVLRRDGVDLSRIVTVGDAATGAALIVIDDAGENQIAVAPGANKKLGPYDVETAGFDAVLCQLEIRDDTVLEAARQATGLFCLNAAPARPLPTELLERADIIIVNETEHTSLHEQLTGYQGLLVVTRGAEGAIAYRDNEAVASAAPPVVKAVDTVGAGDAFCGALVAHLASDSDIAEALARACEAGAKAATRQGAQTA